jgi:membrane fusion protein, multidrug efflux system
MTMWHPGTLIWLAALGAAACATEARGPSERSSTPPAGRPPVAVAVAPAGRHDVVEAIDVVGSLAPKFASDVKAEVTAIVSAVYVTEWAPVRAGDLLARLDTTEPEAILGTMRAGAAQAQVLEQRARREHERAQRLLEYGLITTQAFDDAQSALEAATAAVRAAEAQIGTAQARLTRFVIKAPMDGIVAQRGVNVGDRVESMGGGTAMFRIVDPRLLELTVSVPSASVAALRVGQPLEFSTDARPERTFTGRVMFINPAVDEASRAARVIAEVRNDAGELKGGLFARGRIVTAARAGAVTVPREALLEWNVRARTASVFVVAAGCAEKRAVRVGAVTADGVEIAAGLAAGDAVVTRGGFAVRPGDPVTTSAQ